MDYLAVFEYITDQLKRDYYKMFCYDRFSGVVVVVGGNLRITCRSLLFSSMG